MRMEKQRRLQLVLKPGNPPLPASCRVDEVLTLVTVLEVENCDKCDVVLVYDSNVFEPKDTPASVTLGPGSHQRELEWKLLALTSTKSTWVRVTAISDGVERTTGLPVEVVA